MPTRRRVADRGLAGGDDGDAHAAAVDVEFNLGAWVGNDIAERTTSTSD